MNTAQRGGYPVQIGSNTAYPPQNIPPGYPPGVYPPPVNKTQMTGGYQPAIGSNYGTQMYNTGQPSYIQTGNQQQGQWYSNYYNQITQQEMAQLANWFNTVDRDKSGTIEDVELQEVRFDNLPIGIEVARKLIQVFDRDKNGTIDFVEYASMHKFIAQMRQAFLLADTDRSGRIEAREIFNALTRAGFSFLSMGTINELLHKFDRSQRGLDWREFLLMVSHIANVHTVFQWNDTGQRGSVTLNEDQLVHISAYLI